jgi:serine/threonine protein kinase
MGGDPRDFGAYKLIRRLGVGGMAETFEAARVGEGGFEQRVCLKRVLPAFGDDPEFVARFRREATLAAKLRHSNIVGVIDAGEIDGAHYMALELVDGVDLRSYLRSLPDERLDPDTVVCIATDLAYALEHAHTTLVHRDISPSNILLGRSGDAKLADFGIAKAIEGADVTASRSANGKVPYMAPERMRGESVDARADLFSLGVVMFEALAGQRPFDGAHDVETMRRILANERLRLEDVAPHVTPRLMGIIDRLLEADRDRRTPSATALLEQLAELAPPPSIKRALAAHVEAQRGGPSTRLHVRGKEKERDTELTSPPFTPPPLEKSGPQPRRRRWRFPALLAVVAVVTAVATYEPPPPRPTAMATGADANVDAGADTAAPAATDADPGSDNVPATNAGTETGSGADASTTTDGGTGEIAEAAAATHPGTPAAPAPRRRGWLHVIVEPWGNVWIDGKYFGRAPVKVRVPSGRHVVEVGRDIPARKEVVRVRPGARQEVALTLGAD